MDLGQEKKTDKTKPSHNPVLARRYLTFSEIKCLFSIANMSKF